MSANRAPRVGLIWAQAENGAIGRDGDMPWHLPEDLAHFKRTTLGAPVIMGRRTWESLPVRVRPLPGRSNIVVTRDATYDAPGATVVDSLEAAFAVAVTTDSTESSSTAFDPHPIDAWIMGGGELYRSALPAAAELVITRIDLAVPDADTFAPSLGAEWARVSAGTPSVSSTGLGYRFERWVRAAS